MKIKKERTLKRGRIITLFTAVVLFAGCFKEVSYRTDYVLKPLVQENSGDVVQLLPEGKAQAFAHAADTVFWEVASYEDALAGIITRRDNPSEKQTVPLVTAEPYQQEGIAGWLSMRIDKPSVMVVAVDTEHRIYGYTKQEIADRFTASRERYGNTLATAPNIQYDIKTDETSGEAVFEYATDMKAANKCITGLDLGMNLHEGSKLTLRFYS